MQVYVCEEGESIPQSRSNTTVVISNSEPLKKTLHKVQLMLLSEPWSDDPTEFVASNENMYPVANNLAKEFGCQSTIYH